jgi:hypothetical protein
MDYIAAAAGAVSKPRSFSESSSLMVLDAFEERLDFIVVYGPGVIIEPPGTPCPSYRLRMA